MAEGCSGFKTWLLDLLNGLGVDSEVYGEYILGTLESSADSEPEDVKDMIRDLLSGLMVCYLSLSLFLPVCSPLIEVKIYG